MDDVKYTLAADTTGVVSSLFGVYDDATGLALRGTFVISPEGKLVSATVTSTTWAATWRNSCA